MYKWNKHGFLILCMIVVLTVTGCSKFDAEGFVQAYLDLRLQGEADNAARLNKEKTRGELLEDYEMWIYAFNEVYITGDLDLDDQMLKDYLNLSKQIFSAMRYNVKGSKKQDGVYEVTVEITPVDLFEKYVPKIRAVSEDLMKSYQNGEYEGTDDEINKQLQAEYVYIAYDMLEEASQEMEYKEPETVTIHVEKNDDGDYQVREDDISEMLIRMLCLEEVQQ